MRIVEMKRCKKCGGIPVWMQSSIGCGIGCCDDDVIVAPSMLEAIREWNAKQDEAEGKE